MSKTLGMGSIGIGLAGINHLKTFAACEEAVPLCAADPSTTARAQAAEAVPGLSCTDDYKSMLERDDVELVVVATPHKLHHRMVLDALEAGKHVFCEKPLAINSAECDEMIAAAHAAGRQLLVNQTMRFTPQFRRLRRIIEENDMGRRLFAIVLFLGNELDRMQDPASWKCSSEQAGGGVLLDGGVHAVDLCNWYFGWPVSVAAQIRVPDVWPEGKGEPTGQMLITYEDSTVAQVLATFEARLKGGGGLNVSANLYYENGNAYGGYVHLGGLKSSAVARHVGADGHEEVIQPSPEDGLDYARHVLDCVLHGAEPAVTAQDARMAVAVIEAAYESARTARNVDIPALPA